MVERIPVTSTEGPPPAGPYSHGIRVGDLLFVSGQGPLTTDGKVIEGDFIAQAHRTFDNIEAIARAAGTDLSNAVRIGCFLSTLDHFAQWNEVCAQRLTEPYPVRTTVPVPLTAFDIEIDAVIAIP